MLKAEHVRTVGDLTAWLADHGLRMKPLLTRKIAAQPRHRVELRKARQPHVAKALVVGVGHNWQSAVYDALFQYEEKVEALYEGAVK